MDVISALARPRNPAPVMQPIEHSIAGNLEGPTVVFVHGWPDDASLWRRQVDVLGAYYRCVLLTLPNFGEKSEKAGGYDFPELVARIATTIQKVQPSGRVKLVTHDWGAYLGYLLEQSRPELVERMAALDIGGHLHPVAWKNRLMVMGYQWPLILSWWAGGVLPSLGRAMTRAVGKKVRVPKRQLEQIHSRYNYLYFYLWRAMVLPWHRKKLLTRYRPRCPVLFLFGERKPLMFHSEKWLEVVAASGGRARGVEGAGHWLMESHAETVNRELLDWFSQEPV
jgi:pimeloyl-ACP methyl ester carboxylesterase